MTRTQEGGWKFGMPLKPEFKSGTVTSPHIPLARLSHEAKMKSVGWEDYSHPQRSMARTGREERIGNKYNLLVKSPSDGGV